MEGDDVIGEIETLSAFHGPDVARMVLYDKVNLGFSLRALGSVDTMPDGTIQVLTPIKPITYDLVSNPSHAKARVLEFLPESVDLNNYNDMSVINESIDETDLFWLQQDGIRISPSDIFEHHFVKDIVTEQFNKSIKLMKFKF